MDRTCLLFLTVCIAGCSSSAEPSAKAAALKEPLASIAIDGSSTVLPVSRAIGSEFEKSHPTKVSATGSGTGAGFKKLCSKQVRVIGASRPISASEVELCKSQGVDYFELPIAYDGIVVVVHPSNSWVDHLTVAELKKLWDPSSENQLTKWSQLRPGFPDRDIHLFGPGLDSGTYDYFTKAIVGEEHQARRDYTASEDDDVLVKDVAGDPLALSFFGLAYYTKNQDKLKAVSIDDGNAMNGNGPIPAAKRTILDASYQPLSRPLFFYVSQYEAQPVEIRKLVAFALLVAPKVVSEVGYIPLPQSYYQLAQARFDLGKTGSSFANHGSTVGADLRKGLESR